MATPVEQEASTDYRVPSIWALGPGLVSQLLGLNDALGVVEKRLVVGSNPGAGKVALVTDIEHRTLETCLRG